MATVAELFNALEAVECDGKTYELREPNLVEIARFCAWLQSEARAGAARAVELPEEDRRNLLRDVAADVAAGRYDYGGEVYVRRATSPGGFAKMLAIMFPDVPLEEWQGVVQTKFFEVAAVVNAAHQTDPKAMAAVLASVGLPPDFLDGPPTSSASGSPDFVTRPTDAPPTSAPSG